VPNPVRSTIKHFGEEYDEHIRKKHCSAGQCRGLFEYRIVADSCKGCGLCRKACPQDAISGERKKPHVIDQAKCVQCGACLAACSFSAVARL